MTTIPPHPHVTLTSFTPFSYDPELHRSNRSRQDISLTHAEGLLLIYSKNKIQHVLTKKSPLFYYSGHTQKQQDDFIKWIKAMGPDKNLASDKLLYSDAFQINAIVTSLYNKTKLRLNSFLSQVIGGDAFKNELLHQKNAEEMMQNLRSRNCEVVIFTLEHMNLLETYATSTSSIFGL